MLEKYLTHFPQLETGVFVHDRAQVIGRVHLQHDASVWPMAVLRGDIEPIFIGAQSNVQDNAVLHTVPGIPVKLGHQVTVGHSAILHGCTISDRCIIGMGAIILDGAQVGSDCIIAAGSVVVPKAVIPSGYMAMGTPARALRKLTEEEMQRIVWNAQTYLKLKADYQS